MFEFRNWQHLALALMTLHTASACCLSSCCVFSAINRHCFDFDSLPWSRSSCRRRPSLVLLGCCCWPACCCVFSLNKREPTGGSLLYLLLLLPLSLSCLSVCLHKIYCNAFSHLRHAGIRNFNALNRIYKMLNQPKCVKKIKLRS